MILSKLTTANKREAIAAPEMRASATMRRSDAVLVTVAGETSDGSEYATAMVDNGAERPAEGGELRGRRVGNWKVRRVKCTDAVDVSDQKKPSASARK